MRILYWLVTVGLIILGALGYIQGLLNFQWLPAGNLILLVLFLWLSFGNIALTRYNEAQIEKRNRRFRILAQATTASPQDDLKGLAWDGSRLWLTGRLGEVHGLFRLNADLRIDSSVAFEDGWAYGVTYADSLVVVKGLTDGSYRILEYDSEGLLLREFPLPFEIPATPGLLTFDGKHFWLGIDVLNFVYKVTANYKIIEQHNTTHRLLGATSARNCLWLTDAYNIYQYGMNFKPLDKYQYPGTSCRGMAFDGKFIWSLDDGPKRLYKHLLE